MIDAYRLRDAARVAAKARHPTDIHLDARGFRVVVQNGGLQAAKFIEFDDVEFAQVNPLVDAVRALNVQVG